MTMLDQVAPWAATRTTTRLISSPAVASAAVHRMCRRTIPTVARQSTRGLLATPVIASARSNENRSKRPSVGLTRWAGCARPDIAGGRWWNGFSCGDKNYDTSDFVAVGFGQLRIDDERIAILHH